MSEEHRDQAERPRSPGELRFFGAITASVSHEINNVLAMVNELSGLFEDSLMMARKGRPLDPERLSGIAERISGQVERGKEIVTGLNTFAHCVDNPRASLDLSQNLEQITALCQRFARLRRAELTIQPPVAPVRLQGCAFVLQHVLYRCIELCLEISEEDDRISIELEHQADAVLVHFTGSSGAELTEAAARMQTALVEQARDLGGTVHFRAEPGEPPTMALRLPLLLNGSLDPSASQQE